MNVYTTQWHEQTGAKSAFERALLIIEISCALDHTTTEIIRANLESLG